MLFFVLWPIIKNRVSKVESNEGILRLKMNTFWYA